MVKKKRVYEFSSKKWDYGKAYYRANSDAHAVKVAKRLGADPKLNSYYDDYSSGWKREKSGGLKRKGW